MPEREAAAEAFVDAVESLRSRSDPASPERTAGRRVRARPVPEAITFDEVARTITAVSGTEGHISGHRSGDLDPYRDSGRIA